MELDVCLTTVRTGCGFVPKGLSGWRCALFEYEQEPEGLLERSGQTDQMAGKWGFLSDFFGWFKDETRDMLFTLGQTVSWKGIL